jgi:hypothetical protein
VIKFPAAGLRAAGSVGDDRPPRSRASRASSRCRRTVPTRTPPSRSGAGTRRSRRTSPRALSGPAGVTFDDLAAVLSRLLGRTVRYQPGSTEEVTGHLAARGAPAFVVEQILAIFAALRAGAQAQPGPTVEELLGRPARSVDAFLGANSGAFRAAS